MNKEDFLEQATDKLQEALSILARLIKEDSPNAIKDDAVNVYELLSQAWYITSIVPDIAEEPPLDFQDYEVVSESNEGLPPNEGVITFAKRQVDYDWWVIKRDGVPELEDGTWYLYTVSSEQIHEFPHKDAGRRFTEFDGFLFDATNTKVIRVCKARRWQGDE